LYLSVVCEAFLVKACSCRFMGGAFFVVCL
jgi:hypothetical protein